MNFIQPTSSPDKPLSIKQLNETLYSAIETSLPNDIWLKGEVQSMSVSRNGHAYLELQDENEKINTPVVIFSNALKSIQKKLVESGAIEVQSGHVFTFKGRIGMYVAGGKVQCIISDVDATHALGEKALARQKLIDDLTKSGLINKNKSITLHQMPLNIALFTANNSAACADFCDEIKKSNIGFEIDLYDIPVQGNDAPSKISTKISQVLEIQKQTLKYDLAVLIRGGGSQNDLAAFDDEKVVNSIINSTLPFFTGIGHEIDTSVCDLVAFESHKTPTATAQAIINIVNSCWEEKLDKINTFFQTIKLHMSEEKSKLNDYSQQLIYRTKASLVSSSHRLEGIKNEIVKTKATIDNQENILKNKLSLISSSFSQIDVAYKNSLETKKTKLSLISRTLREKQKNLEHKASIITLSDPSNILLKGFSLLKQNNKYLSTIDKIDKEKNIEIIMHDGKVDANVTLIEKLDKK